MRRRWLLDVLAAGAALLFVAAHGNAQVLPGNPLSGLATLSTGGETRRASSADANWQNGNADATPIPVGETLVLADLQGPGVITHIWNTIAGAERSYSRLLRLRMYWDDEKEPSVDCPLGDFFAAGHGMDVPLDSLPVRVTSHGRARNCYWPMPFRKSARITLTNEGRRPIAVYYYVDWEKRRSLDNDVAYFHAQYRQEFPTVMGRNYLVADIAGRGHYIGTVLSVRALSPEWWGEGDDQFFIDGDREPTLRGTGAEDYFCDAWGFVKQSGPYYGAPVWEGNETDGGRTTVYRWHIADPIHFTRSLRFELEHKGVTFNPDGTIKTHFEERSDEYSSVAFWYQTEPHKPFPSYPVGYARLPHDPAKIIEAEGLLAEAKITDGDVIRQELPGRSGGAQLLWRATKADQRLEIPFTVGEAGTYELLLLATQSWDFGIYQLELDGKPLGRPIDLYSAATSDKEYRFVVRDLPAGRHTLAFVNRGKNAASAGYLVGLDGLLITRR